MHTNFWQNLAPILRYIFFNLKSQKQNNYHNNSFAKNNSAKKPDNRKTLRLSNKR